MGEFGQQAVLVTGASGTVGTALLPRLASRFHRITAVGRQRPASLRPTDAFIRADLAVSAELEAASGGITGSIGGVVLAAGVDCRSGLAECTQAEFETVMRVNCLSGLRLVAAAVRHCDARALPVVAFSSDVVGNSLAGTVVYGASKAALEDGLRHAVADSKAESMSRAGLAVLLVRLPDIGIPMMRLDGTRPPPAPERLSTASLAALGAAVDRAVAFLSSLHLPYTVEVWAHA